MSRAKRAPKKGAWKLTPKRFKARKVRAPKPLTGPSEFPEDEIFMRI